MNECAESDINRVRLCHLRTLPEFSGYGFSLRTDSKNDKQLIENVESNSPAERGKLISGDIILKINGKRVAGLSHLEVVRLIQENAKEVKLLVLQPPLLSKFSEYEDLVAQAEKETIICEVQENTSNNSELTKAEKNLLRSDATTTNIVRNKKQQQSHIAGPGCVNHAMTDDQGRILS
ncbi:PDZ/DHR/GLGF domain protein [Opisthorchis viverrini]|uniref:PDZ/DHR/GLGF domain protein n=1 Tax=Opisthorchis viverrini TaxID=6198 RepID=A0A1S8XB42_OPIVI|nr:PDZ/DHR/GLGF domain protein [Opisthorchis viverrini]